MDRSGDDTMTGRHILGSGLAGLGYRESTVLGPFAGRDGAEFVATIHDGRGDDPLVLRGTFEEVRAAIARLPPWRG